MTGFTQSGPGTGSGSQFGASGTGGSTGSGPGRPGAAGGGQGSPPPGSGSPPPPPPPPPGGGRPDLTSALLEMVKHQGSASQVTDAITQALLAILGSGPSIAAFENLMSINTANGMMYYNAVDHQQKTNLLGMAMTAKCVRYMLDPPSYDGFAEAVNGPGDPTHG